MLELGGAHFDDRSEGDVRNTQLGRDIKAITGSSAPHPPTEQHAWRDACRFAEGGEIEGDEEGMKKRVCESVQVPKSLTAAPSSCREDNSPLGTHS